MPTHDDGVTYDLPCGCRLRFQITRGWWAIRCLEHPRLDLSEIRALVWAAPGVAWRVVS